MKTLLALALPLFSFASFAGSVGSSSFTTTGSFNGRMTSESVSTSTEVGSGERLIFDGAAYRHEEYSKNNSTVVNRDSRHRTSGSYATSGYENNGVGYSETVGSSRVYRGRAEVTATTDNVTQGDYTEGYVLPIFGNIETESGTFTESYVSNDSGYERYNSTTNYDSSEMWTDY